MSEEELEDLLGIGCCEYHIEIGKEAKKEIERQKEVINGMIENEEKYNLEIIKLKSIIKEVREKIENTTINCDGVADDLIDDIYEILEKEKINETKRF